MHICVQIVNGSVQCPLFAQEEEEDILECISSGLYRLWAAIDFKKNFSVCVDRYHFPQFSPLEHFFFLFPSLSPTSEMHQSIWLPIKCTILFPSIQLFTASVNPFSVQFVYDSCFLFFIFSLYFFAGLCSLDTKIAIKIAFNKFWYCFGLFCTIFGIFRLPIFIISSAVAANFQWKRMKL